VKQQRVKQLLLEDTTFFQFFPSQEPFGWVDLHSLVAAVHLKRTALCVKVVDNRVQVSSVEAMIWHHRQKLLISPLLN
jgi:hypothetical protein